MTVTIAVEDISAMAGHPAAGVTITATGRVTVTRRYAGRASTLRTARNIMVSGEEFVEDHEVPVGTETVYVATSSTGDTGTAAITVSNGRAWLSDPLDYTSGIALGLGLEQQRAGAATLLSGSSRTVSLPQPYRSATPLGGRLPVALGGTRMEATAYQVRVLTQTEHDTSEMRELLAAGGPVLLRVPHGVSDYLVGDWEASTDPATGWVWWQMKATAVASPEVPVLIVRHSYADVLSATGTMTYTQVKDLQGAMTYARVKRDPLTMLGG